MNEYDPKRPSGADEGHTRRADDEEFSYETNSVVSATECTGLTASMPESEYEAQSYEDIYNIGVKPSSLQDKKSSRK